MNEVRFQGSKLLRECALNGYVRKGKKTPADEKCLSYRSTNELACKMYTGLSSPDGNIKMESDNKAKTTTTKWTGERKRAKGP